MHSSKATLKQKAYEQLKEFVLIAGYLWVVFGLLILYKSAVLTEYRVDFAYHGLALVNALALAKVMLVAKDFHLGERFNEAPLIYPTLIKSALFTTVLAGFKLLEDAALGLYRRETLRESISDLAGGTWKGILTLTLLLFVVLIPFVGFGELQRVVGKEKLVEFFFRQHASDRRPA
jgi:hypothetical protein